MSDTIIYEFDARNATPPSPWDTNPAKMVDGTETSYAETASGGDEEELTGNECAGTDLGDISKVELRLYGYGDDNDKIILTPVFTGGDGDDHTVVPGVSAGWKAWQDITSDTNKPEHINPVYEQYTTGEDSQMSVTPDWKRAETFTPDTTHNITAVGLKLYRQSVATGTLSVGITAVDGSGAPTGADLTLGTLAVADITPSSPGAWYVVQVTSYELSASTQYAIVLSKDGLYTVYWRADGSVATYSGGKAWYDAGEGWEEPSGTQDFMFKEGAYDDSWAWSDVQSLDCDVEYDNVGKSNTMYCGMVQIQVTYTAEAPPGGQPTRIRTWGIPTGPGYFDRPGKWNAVSVPPEALLVLGELLRRLLWRIFGA